jgi:hypothetical protein
MSDGKQYIKSTKPGYHWNVYTYKPQGRPGYAVAVEGQLDNVGTGIQSFTTVVFQDRQLRIDIMGRMTKNSRNAALQRLWDTMQEQKLVADGEKLALIT